MTNYTAVFTGTDGDKKPSNVQVMQNAIETALVFDCYFEDGTAYTFAIGDVVTGVFQDKVTPANVYAITGTIAPSEGNSTMSWVRSTSDVGLPGDYVLSLKVVSSGADPDYSILTSYKIIEVPEGVLVPPSPLVGVPAADAAWLAAQNAALSSVDDDNMVNVQSGVLTDAGFAMTWNAAEQTADLPLNDNVTLQVGQEFVFLGRNNEGSQITNKQVVKTSGSTGTRVTMDLAQADTVENASNVGMVTEPTIDNNAEGFATIAGKVRGIDTSMWADGAVLYLSTTTAGALTDVKPTWPDIIVGVAQVERSHPSNGILLVRAYETASGAHEKAAAAQAAAIAASVAKAGDTMTGSLFMDTADIELVQTGQTARGVINFNSYINGWVGLWGIRTNVTPTSTNAAVAIDAFNGSVKINAPTTKTVSLAVNNVNKIRMSDNYIALFGATPTDGANVIVVKDVTVAPTVAPTGAGILFSQGGALKWLGSGGTITTIAPA